MSRQHHRAELITTYRTSFTAEERRIRVHNKTKVNVKQFQKRWLFDKLSTVFSSIQEALIQLRGLN